MVPSLAQHLYGYLHIKMHLSLTALDRTAKCEESSARPYLNILEDLFYNKNKKKRIQQSKCRIH